MNDHPMTSGTTSCSRGWRLASLAVMAAAVAGLQACGGGNGSPSPAPAPPPPPGPAPTVTSTTVQAGLFGTSALVTLQGTNLDSNALAVTATGCDGMTLITSGDHASTPTTANFQCNVSAYAGVVTARNATSGATLSAQSFTVPLPAVANAGVAVTRYGAPVLLTLQGTALDSGLVVTSSHCLNLTRLTTPPHQSTATTAYYQCSGGKTTGTFSVQTGVGTALVTPAPSYTVPTPVVTMAVTNGQGVNGNIVLTLNADGAPNTVTNFLSYVNSGFYDGTIFHRVVQNFIIQGGGYGATVGGKLPAPKATNAGIPLELGGGNNVQWSVAMANTGAANSTTSQFFFNVVENATLNGHYSVFGNITSGVPVAQAILAAPATCTTNTGAGTTDCLPQPDVTITSATQTQ